jgi:phosphotriesterase-related protein
LEHDVIRTVAGDVDTISGRILPHEHLQIDLSAQKGAASRLGAAEEPDVIEDLRKAKALGLAGITDLSAPGWGRDPRALRRIGEGAGVHVVCASGYYWDPYPDIAVTGSVEAMRDHMIAEVTTGVDGSGIRCGLIKVGTRRGAPGEPAEKLFRAAALAAMATGVPVITHTSTTDQAAWQIRVLEGAGMDMRRVVISHMGAAENVAELVEVARAGVFMGIDKVSFPKGPTNVQLADLVRAACDKGLERQLLLSSDVARKTFLQRHGGRSYSTVFADFVPMLRERGLSPALIESLLSDNPRRMLTLAA